MARTSVRCTGPGMVRIFMGRFHGVRVLGSFRHSVQGQGSGSIGAPADAFLCAKTAGVSWRTLGYRLELSAQDWCSE